MMNIFRTHTSPFHSIAGLFLLFLLLTMGCKTDEFKELEQAAVVQEGSYAFAIGTAGFTLADLLENDTLLRTGTGNDIKLIYRKEHFFQLTASDLLDELTGKLNETFTRQSAIGEIAIDDISQSTSIAFGNMLDDFSDLILVNYISSSDGTMAQIPPFNETITTKEQAPAFSDFSSLTLSQGLLSLSITNNLFFDIEDFSIEVTDVTNNQSLGTFQFDYIATGETKTSQIDLAGKTIGNEFEVSMSNLKTPGTGNEQVLIDLDAQLDVLFEVKDLIITEGIVNIPAGVLQEEELFFEINTDNNERIKSILLNDAEVSYEISSDVPTDMEVRLTFPSITRNNAPLTQTLTIPPTGATGTVTGSFDFSNTLWLLNQDTDQPYNRIQVIYEVSMPNGSGGQLTFSATDQVSISLNIKNLDVEEVTGYFGLRQEDFEESTFDTGLHYEFLTDQSNPVWFSDPIMRIDITNSFGIPLQGEFNATATGAFGGQASLNPPKMIINSPSFSEMGQSVNTVFVVNKNNSDLVDMLAVFPSNIHFAGTATINPNGDPSVLNFIRSDSHLDASAEFDLPFQLRATNLVYRDTARATDLGFEGAGYTIDDVESAGLKIVFDNGLPLSTTIKMTALDHNGNEAIIAENVRFDAASVDANGRVNSNGHTRGEVFVELNRDQIRWLNQADQYIYEIQLQTTNEGQSPVALYTDYRVDMGAGIRLEVRRN